MIRMKQINSLDHMTSFDYDLKMIKDCLDLGVEESIKGCEFVEFNFTTNIANLFKLSHEHKAKRLSIISTELINEWCEKYSGPVLNNLSQLENDNEYCDDEYVSSYIPLLQEKHKKKSIVSSSSGNRFKICVSDDGKISTVVKNE